MKVWGQGNWPSLSSIRNSKKTNRTSCQIKCNWFKNHWRCWSVTPFRLPAEVAKSDEQLNTGKGQAHWHSQDWSHSINTKQLAPTRSTSVSVSEPYLCPSSGVSQEKRENKQRARPLFHPPTQLKSGLVKALFPTKQGRTKGLSLTLSWD